MSHDSQSIENLTEKYMSQSPAAFTSMAMSAHKEPNDYSKRIDEEIHGGDSKCDYPCCNEEGYCSTIGGHVAVIGGVVCCCACCCYVTNGFGGVWTYWPF